MKPGNRKTFPFRRLQFEKQSVLIELPENELKRTDEDLFKSSIMLNLNQLQYMIDSLQKTVNARKNEMTQDGCWRPIIRKARA